MTNPMTMESLEQVARSCVESSAGRTLQIGVPLTESRGGMGLFEASQSGVKAQDLLRKVWSDLSSYLDEMLQAGVPRRMVTSSRSEAIWELYYGAKQPGPGVATVTIDLTALQRQPPQFFAQISSRGNGAEIKPFSEVVKSEGKTDRFGNPGDNITNPLGKRLSIALGKLLTRSSGFRPGDTIEVEYESGRRGKYTIKDIVRAPGEPARGFILKGVAGDVHLDWRGKSWELSGLHNSTGKASVTLVNLPRHARVMESVSLDERKQVADYSRGAGGRTSELSWQKGPKPGKDRKIAAKRGERHSKGAHIAAQLRGEHLEHTALSSLLGGDMGRVVIDEENMSSEQLIKAFDALKPKQRVKVALKAVMGHGSSEGGTPTEYIVGRRTKSRGGYENVGLLPGDGSKPRPGRKVTLYKRTDINGDVFVSVALGDMGATLLSID